MVGLGWAAQNRHLPWLRRTPGAELVGVVDPSEPKAASIGRRYGVDHASAPGPAGIPWLERVDAVTIAVPPAAHHRLALAYLEAGKHVLVEKPMAMTVAEADEMIRAAARGRRLLAVVHNFQFSRSMRKLTRLLEEGRLGRVRSVWAVQLSNPDRRLPEWYEELPLGLFYDESPHLLYLLRRVLGAELELISAHVSPSTLGKRTPALVSADFRAGEVPVHMALSFEAPVSEWQLAVLGERLLAVVDVFRDILATAPNDGRHLGLDVLRTSFASAGSHFLGTFTSGVLHAAGRLSYGNDEVMGRFVRACVEGKPPEGIGGGDGKQVVALQHEVLKAAPPVTP